MCSSKEEFSNVELKPLCSGDRVVLDELARLTELRLRLDHQHKTESQTLKSLPKSQRNGTSQTRLVWLVPSLKVGLVALVAYPDVESG